MELTGLWLLVIGTVAAALVFDVINGFHDAANSIATVVSTRVLSPRVAVLWAAFFNFVAMFVFAPKVADTISKIVYIQQGDPDYVEVVLAGLVGAIAWDLLTWWWSLPTSSSHALIGGFAGAGIATVLSFVFTPLLSAVRRQVNKWYNLQEFHPSKTLHAYSEQISNILDMQRLANVAVGLIIAPGI